ncbi:hypothetical protein VTN00DRAFT_3038 [Thermoascus crustaceus]|uniref:uncharacterized protein n=1 Tax=Thermoascus crustaceus TaxID=5088 RepID=UPI003743BE0D
MAHASSRTFINHYRPRRHPGMQEIMVFSNLTEEEKTSVERDPELQAAIGQLEASPGGATVDLDNHDKETRVVDSELSPSEQLKAQEPTRRGQDDNDVNPTDQDFADDKLSSEVSDHEERRRPRKRRRLAATSVTVANDVPIC